MATSDSVWHKIKDHMWHSFAICRMTLVQTHSKEPSWYHLIRVIMANLRAYNCFLLTNSVESELDLVSSVLFSPPSICTSNKNWPFSFGPPPQPPLFCVLDVWHFVTPSFCIRQVWWECLPATSFGSTVSDNSKQWAPISQTMHRGTSRHVNCHRGSTVTATLHFTQCHFVICWKHIV